VGHTRMGVVATPPPLVWLTGITLGNFIWRIWEIFFTFQDL